jgi:hypothetical protein
MKVVTWIFMAIGFLPLVAILAIVVFFDAWDLHHNFWGLVGRVAIYSTVSWIALWYYWQKIRKNRSQI